MNDMVLSGTQDQLRTEAASRQMGHYEGQTFPYTTRNSFLGPSMVILKMSTGKMTGKWSWKMKTLFSLIAHGVFMSSPEHSMSGWDCLGARRGDSDGLARSRDQDIPRR